MITHLPGMPLPTESTLDITIHVTQPLNITAFSARQRVTQYVMLELSSQLGGDTPELIVGERVNALRRERAVAGRGSRANVHRRRGQLMAEHRAHAVTDPGDGIGLSRPFSPA